jgi:hypothetical protein
MRRREFLSIVGGATAWPFAVGGANSTDAVVAPASWPNASTTGVPAGTAVTTVNGDLNSNSNGQIIEERKVSGTIVVRHPNVVVRNCRAGAIFVEAAGIGTKVEDCEVTGGVWNSGITLLPSNCIIRRCDISRVENGIWLEANDCLIEDNYLHDLAFPGNLDPHYDGLQIPGSSANNVIRHNNFALAREVSSCITMKDATNISIDRNRLNGGSYIIYFEGKTTDCTVTNNVLGQYVFGVFNGTAGRAQTYSGNTFERG